MKRAERLASDGLGPFWGLVLVLAEIAARLEGALPVEQDLAPRRLEQVAERDDVLRPAGVSRPATHSFAPSQRQVGAGR